MHFCKFSHLALTLLVQKMFECCECVYCEELQELIFMITINFPSFNEKRKSTESGERRAKPGVCGVAWPSHFWQFWENIAKMKKTLDSRILRRVDLGVRGRGVSMMVASIRGGAVTRELAVLCIHYICLHFTTLPLWVTNNVWSSHLTC